MNDTSIVKQELDKISPTMCLAKWLQVSLKLPTGKTHSCHHPVSHKIPLECIDHPALLHNTPQKKEMRRQMLSGDKPTECDYCWTMEKNSSLLSDRYLKSSRDWAFPYLDEIVNSPYDKDFIPTYLEVSFNHLCNMKCIYCDPHVSSSIYQDTLKYGAFSTNPPHNRLVPNSIIFGDNPYVKAFWKWWPDVYPKLNTIRVTGGEPLLHKELYILLDYLIEQPRKINLAVNTNLSVPQSYMDKFFKKIERLQDTFNEITIFTSCEAKDGKAEYIRYGMNYNILWDRIDKLLSLPKIKVGIMAAYNLLSVSSYTDFLKDIHLRKSNSNIKDRLFIDHPFLRYPRFLNSKILTQDYVDYVNGSCKYLSDNEEFSVEVKNFYRIYDIIINTKEDVSVLNERKNFYIFIKELDRRRGTNFIKTFPEYEDFLNLCGRKI